MKVQKLVSSLNYGAKVIASGCCCNCNSCCCCCCFGLDLGNGDATGGSSTISNTPSSKP